MKINIMLGCRWCCEQLVKDAFDCSHHKAEKVEIGTEGKIGNCRDKRKSLWKQEEGAGGRDEVMRDEGWADEKGKGLTDRGVG